MSNFLFPRNWERTDDLAKPAIETPLGMVRLETQIHGSVLIFDRVAPTASTERLPCKVPDEPDLTDCRAALGRIRAQNEPLTISV